MKYQHFSIEEREKIQEMLWRKQSLRAIAKEIRGFAPVPTSAEEKKDAERSAQGTPYYQRVTASYRRPPLGSSAPYHKNIAPSKKF